MRGLVLAVTFLEIGGRAHVAGGDLTEAADGGVAGVPATDISENHCHPFGGRIQG